MVQKPSCLWRPGTRPLKKPFVPSVAAIVRIVVARVPPSTWRFNVSYLETASLKRECEHELKVIHPVLLSN